MHEVLAASCPDDGQLARFVEHQLAETEAEALRDHLDSCETCRHGVMAWVQPATESDDRGLTLGHYRLERRLGAGGMGVVYAAFDSHLERPVAIKLLASSADERVLLLAEARAQARVQHPAVLTIYEAGEADGVGYIAMERICGATLRAHLAARRPRVAGVLALYVRAAEGLAAAHAQGVIHRDFKPDNVLVEEDPATGAARRVVIADFGLAACDEGKRAPAGGTPRYMAPEQLDGGTVDARADVFAFAVALWEGLYAAPPFAGDTVEERRVAMTRAPVPPARPRVPARVRDVLVRALAVDVAARPASIAAIAAELAPASRRRKRIAGAIALVALAAGGIAAVRPPREHAIACTADLEAWRTERSTWDARASAAGVPPWVRARVERVMEQRAVEVATRGATACRAPREAARRGWTACREQQAILERATLTAIAQPWPSYARLDEALELPWVSTCASRAAELAAVLAPTDRTALAEARTLLANAQLAWTAGQPNDRWSPAIARLADVAPEVHAAIAIDLRLFEAAVAGAGDAPRRAAILDAAIAEAERSTDLVGAAQISLAIARSRAASGNDPTGSARAFERAGWAIERIGDPPALRAAWHAGMVGLAWERSDLETARVHARAASALETTGGATRRHARSALAAAAGASAKFGEQRRFLETNLRDASLEGGDVDDVLTWSMYAEALYALGELDDALPAIERSLAIARSLGLHDDPIFAQSLLIRSFVELDRGEPDRCLATITEAEQLIARVAGPDHALVGAALNVKASALGAREDWSPALAAAEQAAAFFERTKGARSIEAVFARQQIGELAKQTGDLPRARTELRWVVDTARGLYGDADVRTLSAEQYLGSLLVELGEIDAARALLEHAVAGYAAAEIDPAIAAQASATLATVLVASPTASERARGRALAAGALAAWRADPAWRAEAATLARELARAPRR